MDERLRHSDQERAVAREGLATIRAQLGRPRPVPDQGRTHPIERDDAIALPHLEAEMAWGAERDQLLARVTALETEIGHLRRALAAIVHHAAHAISPPPPDNDTSPTRPL